DALPVSRWCGTGAPLLRRACTGKARRLPPTRPSAVLLVQPGLERREVIEERGRVHLALTGERFEGVRPRAALSEREHRLEPLARFPGAVDRAAAERSGVARGLAQRAGELELEAVGEEVARLRHARGSVALAARVAVLLAARARRGHALVLLAQLPPRPIVLLRPDPAREPLPAPMVHEQPARQERALLERVAPEQA